MHGATLGVGHWLVLLVVIALIAFLARRGAKAGGGGALCFRNPVNGYVETISHPLLWTLLFGAIYFAYKGIWLHAFFSIVLAIATACVSWLVYPFFARDILRKHYLRAGWQEVAEPST